MITIETTGDAIVARQLADYPSQIDRAMLRASNRAIGAARTFMVKSIAGDTGLKSTDVRNALPMTQATMARPEARLAAGLKRLMLIKFGAKGPEPSRGRGRGVSYKLAGSRGRLEHAFITTMPSGRRGVFERSAGKFMRGNPKRQAIHEKKGVSLGHVFRKFMPAALERAREVFKTNLDHELKFRGLGATQDNAPVAESGDV